MSISLAINRPTSALTTVDKSTNFVIYFVKYFGFTYNLMYLLGYISICKGICIFSCNFLSLVLAQRHWNNRHSDNQTHYSVIILAKPAHYSEAHTYRQIIQRCTVDKTAIICKDTAIVTVHAYTQVF